MGATFDDAVREHGPALWRVVASYAPPGAERDDLAQDVLLAVWQAFERFRGESSLKTSLLRVAHNRCLTHAWKRSRSPLPAELDAMPDPRPAPDEQAATHQQRERLLRHLRVLPLGQRQVLTLALEGLPHLEIAAIVGITVENVAVRLGRAREALRRSLEEEKR